MSVEKVKAIFDSIARIQYFAEIRHKGEYAQKLFKLFGEHLDIERELLMMELWLDDNPGKRKKNYRSFITRWLGRSWSKKTERPKISGGHIADDTGYRPNKHSAGE